jgi:hypothetical protein
MGILLVFAIQPLKQGRLVDPNIEDVSGLRQFQCCGAARLNTHGFGKKRLTFRLGCVYRRRADAIIVDDLTITKAL